MIPFHIFRITFNTFRTLSVYITTLITIERYIVIRDPVQGQTLLGNNQVHKCRFMLFVVCGFSLFLNIPWMIKTTISPNTFKLAEAGYYTKDTLLAAKEFLGFPYIFRRNQFATTFSGDFQVVLMCFDFFAPFPVLILFNGLLYRSVSHEYLIMFIHIQLCIHFSVVLL